jgi:hypothetical protein
MRTIETLDAARAKEVTFEELGVNYTFFWAYTHSREADTETLDFEDVIWERDIPQIVESCRRFEINRSTISCGMSSMAETTWEFEKHGCCLIGMTQVNGRFTNWDGERERKPAFEIRVLPA